MHANEQLIRKGFAAFGSGDGATLASVFADDAVWHAPGQGRLGGAKQGKAAIMGYFGQLAEGSGGTIRADLQEVLANDGRVYTWHKGSAQHNGRTLNMEVVITFTITDGLVTEAREHLDNTAPYDAFFAA